MKTMPKDAAAELIEFISEVERFDTVLERLSGEASVVEIRAMLREVAVGLRNEAINERQKTFDAKECKHLSRQTKKIVSYLSPREEQTLLRTFGFLDK